MKKFVGMKRPFSFKVLKIAKPEIAYRILACIVVRGLSLFVPIIFGTFINYIAKGMYSKAINMIIIGLLIAGFIHVFEIVRAYSYQKLREKLFIEYTKLSTERLFDEKDKGDIGKNLNVLNHDIETMSNFFCSLIRQMIRVLEIFVIFIYFFSIGYYFGFASLSAAAICFIVIDRTHPKIAKVNKEKLASLDIRNSFLNKILSSKKPDKEYKNSLMESTVNYVKKYTKAKITEYAVMYGNLLIIEIFRWGLLGLGIYLMSKGNIEIGILVIIYNYYSQLISGFEEISSVVIKIKQFKVSENRFIKFLNNRKIV